jgi:hypothetical protein
VGVVLRGDSQSPSNDPLSRCVPGVFLERERFAGLGNDFTPASPASIDAGMERRFSGLVLLVELGTDADFYVMAPPEECHGSRSFAEFDASNSTVTRGQTWDSAQTIGEI